DGAPPEYAAGLALVDTVTLDAGSSEDVLTREGDGQGYAEAWCDLTSPEAGHVAAALTSGPGSGGVVGCSGAGRAAPSEPTAVPPLGIDQGLDARLIETPDGELGGLRGADTAIVGLYREATVAEFPYPDQQAVPDPPDHDVVLN